jgi:hypothetical protein
VRDNTVYPPGSTIYHTHLAAASAEQVELNQAHAPGTNAIEAFNAVLHTIKSEVVKSRHHWDKHEPRMWSRVANLSDQDLAHLTIEKDLVLVRLIRSFYLDPTSFLILGVSLHQINIRPNSLWPYI